MTKQDLKNAGYVAITAGVIAASIHFMNKKRDSTPARQKDLKSKSKQILESTLDSAFIGLSAAIKEGSKAIISKPNIKTSSHIFSKSTQSKSTLQSLKAGTFSLCAQVAISSASDLIKLSKGEIKKRECISNIAQNAGGAIGAMMLGRAAVAVASLPLLSSVLGGAAGGLVLGVAGGYVGEYVGRRLVSAKFDKAKKDSKEHFDKSHTNLTNSLPSQIANNPKQLLEYKG